ncbi:FAD-binding oxidoreductase [Actinosynnema sp. CS-041913]|uniref:FAD-binding oxidoreductase n=1 Tax=Actinosynnema sp. CS-041913 TaxID=3239917 RepID=UPI003D8EA6F2
MPSLRQSDWDRLAGLVAGRVRRPGDAGFRARSVPFNTRFAATTPLGVLSVASVADVRAAVKWARDVDVPIVARSGGHSYGGCSVNTGLVVDMSLLNTVHANGSDGIVTAAGGARMADVYAAIEPENMAFALGNGSSVGIAGLVLGGGTAPTSRVYGLTADALVSTTIVTADGELLTCDAVENEDLFWACRGGGGGNFGINVSFEFQARPVVDCSTYLLLWDRGDAPKVFATLQDTLAKAPRGFATRIGVNTTGDNTVVSAIGMHMGPSRELRDLLDPVLSVARPVREHIADETFWGAKDFILHDTTAAAFAAKTNFVAEPLPDEAIATLLAHVDRWPGSGNPDGGGAALFSWGGAVGDVAPDATAFAHRDALFMLNLDTSWADDDEPAVVEANLRWLTDLHRAMAPHVGEGAYVNFIDPDLADRSTAYYGANYPRLLDIKRRRDPDGVFTFDHGIGA